MSIFKGGGNENVGNFRGITLLSVVRKLLTSILNSGLKINMFILRHRQVLPILSTVFNYNKLVTELDIENSIPDS